jgi:hypothetical protein
MVEISKYGSGEGSGGAILRTYSTGHDVPGEALNLMQTCYWMPAFAGMTYRVRH